jgi:hypothetical protein
MERWKNKVHEVSTRRCKGITTTTCEVGFGSYTPYRFDGTYSVDTFISQMQQVPLTH